MYEMIKNKDVDRLIAHELDVDCGEGDATTLALVDPRQKVQAVIQTREDCCVSGTGVAFAVFSKLGNVKQLCCCDDGTRAQSGETLLKVAGPAQAILTAERTALNFMQRMCGIATLTAKFIDAISPLTTQILDTRKTTPGLRVLEKYAVECGGGTNHRFGLFDKIMIKDNHRAFWHGGDGLGAAVLAARAAYPALPIEVEVESIDELEDALSGRPDEVLLDNMSLGDMRACVGLCRGRCKTEASGGITLENVRAVAETGVDAISLGALTHSARSIDLTLEMEGL